MKRGNTIWQKYHPIGNSWSEYPDGSIVSFLEETAAQYPDHTALEFEGKKTTYKVLMNQINSAAIGLSHLGIKKGDYVTVISPNIPQALISIYSLNRLGAVANILHPLLSINEIETFINDTRSKAIIILDMIYPKIKKIAFSGSIILTRIVDALPVYAKPFYSAKNKLKLSLNPDHNVLYWNDLMRSSAAALPTDDGKGNDTAVILYSGGSSGTPKGIIITNSNLNSLAVQTPDVNKFDKIPMIGTHSLALMPVFHGFGLGVCMHAMLCSAMHVFLIPKYDMQATAKLIFKRKIGFLYGVPALFEALSRSAEIETKDLSFIKFIVTAGDRTDPQLINKLNTQLTRGGSPATVLEAYGLTECTSGCCINPFFKVKIGSVGIPYTDMLMKIVKPGTQEEMPIGSTGEICISGPTVMKGYLNNPEETSRALQMHADGRIWLHTGDAGHKDEDGYYYFDQRLSRMIVVSGYNVYPTEVERAIKKCRIVENCCVVGKPDRVIGQNVCAYVVLNNSESDQDTAKAAILQACRENVAEYAIPSDIVFLKSLPMSALGKVDYKALEVL